MFYLPWILYKILNILLLVLGGSCVLLPLFLVCKTKTPKIYTWQGSKSDSPGGNTAEITYIVGLAHCANLIPGYKFRVKAAEVKSCNFSRFEDHSKEGGLKMQKYTCLECASEFHLSWQMVVVWLYRNIRE